MYVNQVEISCEELENYLKLSSGNIKISIMATLKKFLVIRPEISM